MILGAETLQIKILPKESTKPVTRLYSFKYYFFLGPAAGVAPGLTPKLSLPMPEGFPIDDGINLPVLLGFDINSIFQLFLHFDASEFVPEYLPLGG